MRAGSFLLLVALLALGNQLPAALGKRKMAITIQLGNLGSCREKPRDKAHCSEQEWDLQDLVRPLSVKPGACPPDDGPCLSVPDQCLDDSQCPSTTKCCSKACYLQCVPKLSVKRGVCPKDLLRCISPIQHLCQGDFDCSGSKRCCLTACGRDCRSPVKD